MKLIESAGQHHAAMVLVDRLMDLDPDPDTNEGLALNYLAREVERYEMSIIMAFAPEDDAG